MLRKVARGLRWGVDGLGYRSYRHVWSSLCHMHAYNQESRIFEK